MRKAVLVAAFILVLASFVNETLGAAVDAVNGSTPCDRLGLIVHRQQPDPGTLYTPLLDLPGEEPLGRDLKIPVTTPGSASLATEPAASSCQTQTSSTSPTSVKATSTTTAPTTTSTLPPTTRTTTTPPLTTAKPPTTSTKPPTTTAKPTTTTKSPTTSAQGSYCLEFEMEVVRLVNIERAQAGLAPLVMNASLRASAHVRAAELVTKFSHTRPNGTKWSTAINLSYRCAGENIAAGHSTPARVVQGWMGSEGHRNNIMNGNYSEIGVGCYHDPGTSHRYYWAQLFAGF